MSQLTAPRTRRRSLAASAVVAIGAMGLFAGASAASAENIDTDAQGSLTVNVFQSPGNGAQTPDGSGQDPTTDTIDGIVFEYCTIDGVDLFDGTNTGWNTLRNVTAQQLIGARSGTALGSLTLSNCQQLPATVDGISTSGPIDLGAYLVREIDAPATVTKRSEPAIVTLPTPGINQGEGDGSWVYDVQIYPKNDLGDTPTKTIQNQPANGFVLGSDVNYSISQKAPAVTGDVYTKFEITDTLDARLSGSAAPVVSVDGTPLTEGDDYTAEWTTSGDPEQSTLTVTLTGALADLVIDDVVKVDFVATVESLGNGEISNGATVNVNDLDLDGDGTAGTPTNSVWTRWGQLELKKVDADENATGLQGAQFQLLMSEKASGCRLDDDLVAVQDENGDDYTVTSDADGKISVPGLWIGDDELNGGEANNGLQERCYVLVEVKAPNGFILPTGDAAKTEVIVTPGAVAGDVVEIANKQQAVPQLPLTGAAGQGLMIAGGIALLAVAAGSAMMLRRRHRDQV